jgi:dTDP-4-dehydrorhamnose reductase
MIILLGASGYFGQAFEAELRRRELPHRSVSRQQVDYTRFDRLLELLRDSKASFVINAAGFTGRPNVDACETARTETLQGNTLLPLTIGEACLAAGIPWGHLSSGCIYTGAYITEHGHTRLEEQLSLPHVRSLAETSPECFRGFSETDEPNFSFRHPPSSLYSGAKALAEEAISPLGNCYIWRPRLPFDERGHPRNLISKLLAYPKLHESVNSLAHRGEVVSACLDLWLKRAPLGIYNLTNPGFLTTRQIIAAVQKILHLDRTFSFWENEQEFYQHAAKAPRSNCVLDVSKLTACGVTLRPVREALVDALRNWR